MPDAASSHESSQGETKAVLTREQEWAEEVIERGTGVRACRKPLMWRGWNTYCILDSGHDGDCQSYGEVLRLGRKP